MSVFLPHNHTFRPCIDRKGVEYPGYYVSANGKVISTKYRAVRERRSRPATNGYLITDLRRDGRYHTVLVHQLVACAWLGCPDDPSLEVNHKNGVKEDVSVDNLEWVTHLENVHHAIETGLYIPSDNSAAKGEAVANSKLTEADVREARILARQGWMQKDLMKRYGVSRNAMRHALQGITWKHITDIPPVEPYALGKYPHAKRSRPT